MKIETLIIVTIIIVLGLGLVPFLAKKKYTNYRCSDFTTYNEALIAYENGALKLDGDNDKIPCENLRK